MRICILTHGENPFGRHYVEAFHARGHVVLPISLTPKPVEAEGVETLVVGPCEFVPKQGTSRMPYLRAVLPVRRAVREFAPDVLMALFLSSAGIIACLTGHRCVVLSARGGDVNAHVRSRIWRAVFRWQGRRAALIHTVSQPLADTLRERVGVRPGKLYTCPVGVDTDLFAYVDPDTRPAAGRLISTRAHKPVYDQATFVRAMEILKSRGVAFHTTFASAIEAEKTRLLVREAGLEDEVTFLPGYDLRDLPLLLAASDVYVSASLTDGTSSSLLEAMSTGTFPVVSDIPANRPWVRDGEEGCLFPPGDAEALASCLEKSFADADLRREGGQRSRQVILDRGDKQKLMDGILAEFERLVSGAAA